MRHRRELSKSRNKKNLLYVFLAVQKVCSRQVMASTLLLKGDKLVRNATKCQTDAFDFGGQSVNNIILGIATRSVHRVAPSTAIIVVSSATFTIFPTAKPKAARSVKHCSRCCSGCLWWRRRWRRWPIDFGIGKRRKLRRRCPIACAVLICCSGCLWWRRRRRRWPIDFGIGKRCKWRRRCPIACAVLYGVSTCTAQIFPIARPVLAKLRPAIRAAAPHKTPRFADRHLFVFLCKTFVGQIIGGRVV